MPEPFNRHSEPLPKTERITRAGEGPCLSGTPVFDAPERPLFRGYEIIDVVGRGGMGVVYRARQLSLDRNVALKVLMAGVHAGPEDLLRFRIEVESVAQLCHPHIVQVYEVGEEDGVPYCSLEYVEGGSLADKLMGVPMPANEAAQLIATIAQAVEAVHKRGIIHRDLKPGNILLTADGQPKVTDFGLAKRMGDHFSHTQTGAGMGTPSYMAPEQAESAKEAGPAADVYGLGAILYEALTGHPPFEGDSAYDIMAKVVTEEPVPPRKLNPSVPRETEIICLKCLEKDPRRRYLSAAALADDLLRFTRGEPIAARPPGLLGRFDRWARLRPALVATVVVLALFYLTHLSLMALGVPGEGGSYHRFISMTVPLWALAAVLFQRLFSRTRRLRVLFEWVAFDVLMLTLVVYRGDGPSSSLILGYLLLIAGTGLRLRVRLVLFVTGLCLACYVGILLEACWRRPELMVAQKEWMLTALSMVALGLIQYILLRRIGRIPERDR